MPSLSSLIAATYKPKAETIPLIQSALKVYRVCSYITGTFLLLLVIEMVLKYVFYYEVELGVVIVDGLADPVVMVAAAMVIGAAAAFAARTSSALVAAASAMAAVDCRRRGAAVGR